MKSIITLLLLSIVFTSCKFKKNAEEKAAPVKVVNAIKKQESSIPDVKFSPIHYVEFLATVGSDENGDQKYKKILHMPSRPDVIADTNPLMGTKMAESLYQDITGRRDRKVSFESNDWRIKELFQWRGSEIYPLEDWLKRNFDEEKKSNIEVTISGSLKIVGIPLGAKLIDLEVDFGFISEFDKKFVHLTTLKLTAEEYINSQRIVLKEIDGKKFLDGIKKGLNFSYVLSSMNFKQGSELLSLESITQQKRETGGLLVVQGQNSSIIHTLSTGSNLASELKRLYPDFESSEDGKIEVMDGLESIVIDMNDISNPIEEDPSKGKWHFAKVPEGLKTTVKKGATYRVAFSNVSKVVSSSHNLEEFIEVKEEFSGLEIKSLKVGDILEVEVHGSVFTPKAGRDANRVVAFCTGETVCIRWSDRDRGRGRDRDKTHCVQYSSGPWCSNKWCQVLWTHNVADQVVPARFFGKDVPLTVLVGEEEVEMSEFIQADSRGFINTNKGLKFRYVVDEKIAANEGSFIIKNRKIEDRGSFGTGFNEVIDCNPAAIGWMPNGWSTSRGARTATPRNQLNYTIRKLSRKE